jgi:sporulation protein YlmC with PRC-barrel domain
MPTNKSEYSRVSEGTMHPDTRHGAISVHQEEQGYAGAALPVRRVLGATSLTGDRVRNAQGHDVGKIVEIAIDLASGRVAYAVLSYNGLSGVGNKLFAVPWNALRIDQSTHEFVVDVKREVLESASGFDKDNWPDMADTVCGREYVA